MVRARIAAAVCALALCTCAAAAQELDVPTPYVPSTSLNVDEMLRLAAVTADDVVYDLGSGDGRVVLAAVRDYGARGVGVELDPKLVAESNAAAARAGFSDRAAFREADVLTVPVKEATVVTMYLLPPLVRKLQDRLYAELAPGSRIIAHDYPFPDWRADERITVSKTFYRYVVPARVAGRWDLVVDGAGQARRYDLRLEQRYQEVKGAAHVQGGILPAFEAKVAGTRVSFILIDGDHSYRYAGEARGGEMQGTVSWGYGPKQQTARWRAARAGGG